MEPTPARRAVRASVIAPHSGRSAVVRHHRVCAFRGREASEEARLETQATARDLGRKYASAQSEYSKLMKEKDEVMERRTLALEAKHHAEVRNDTMRESHIRLSKTERRLGKGRVWLERESRSVGAKRARGRETERATTRKEKRFIFHNETSHCRLHAAAPTPMELAHHTQTQAQWENVKNGRAKDGAGGAPAAALGAGGGAAAADDGGNNAALIAQLATREAEARAAEQKWSAERLMLQREASAAVAAEAARGRVALEQARSDAGALEEQCRDLEVGSSRSCHAM
jgi:hypothetical protein